jgi:hypothetical protein
LLICFNERQHFILHRRKRGFVRCITLYVKLRNVVGALCKTDNRCVRILLN